MTRFIAGCAFTVLLCLGSAAQADDKPATKAYEAAMAAMHEDMAIAYSGNPDVDFVRGMIPHHEGAVAMAKIVLNYGSDPEIQTLARNVVQTQSDEIAQMKAWLERHDKKVAPAENAKPAVKPDAKPVGSSGVR